MLLIGEARQAIEQKAREAAMIAAGFHQHRHVRRIGARHRRTRRLLIGEGRRKAIAGPRGALKIFAGVVRAVFDLIGSRKIGDFLLRKLRSTGLTKIAERQHFDRMAGRTDFFVDLEAAPQLPLVETAKDAGEAPFMTLGLFFLMADAGARGRRRDRHHGERCNGQSHETERSFHGCLFFSGAQIKHGTPRGH